MAFIKLADDKIYQLIKDRLEWNESYIKLSKKYNASPSSITRILDMYENGTLEKYLEQRRVRLSEDKNIKTVLEYEDMYNPMSYYVKINNFYANDLKIAGNIELSKEDALEEINKLVSLIISEDFLNDYGRSFNLIDMYLSTNLTAKGLCVDYQAYMDMHSAQIINNFLHSELSKVDNSDIFRTYCYSKPNTYRRFTRPATRRINKMLNLDFFLFNQIDASIEDVKAAHDILLDLNEKYGVKYDEISLYILLQTYLEGNIESYYKVADKYKEELDQKTRVQKRCIPLLTRRENI